MSAFTKAGYYNDNEMKLREEARRRGNLAIRIMSGKNRPRKQSVVSKDISNERYQSQHAEKDKLAVKVTEYIQN